MMMMMKMTLPEAMPTKMATSEPMTLEDFPPLSFSSLSLGDTPGRQRGERMSQDLIVCEKYIINNTH